MALACAALLAGFAAQAQDTTGAQALAQVHGQRDKLRNVEVKAPPKLRIGKDKLEFTVKSGKDGFVYVMVAAADNKALTLLFPNQSDANNRIAAGQEMKLPRPTWSLPSDGPPGNNALLVIVSDGPREMSSLKMQGGLITAKNNAEDRAKLYGHLTRSSAAGGTMCSANAPTKDSPMCSGAFGSAMVTVEEVQ
jgi:hypothetical protein